MATDPDKMQREILSALGIRIPAKRRYTRIRYKCIGCGRARKRGERWSVKCDQCHSRDAGNCLQSRTWQPLHDPAALTPDAVLCPDCGDFFDAIETRGAEGRLPPHKPVEVIERP